MEVVVGKIVGRMGEGGWWAQVHDAVIGQGRLITVVSIKSEEKKTEVDLVARGREILARLHELYEVEQEQGYLQGLKGAVEVVGQEFEGTEIVCVAIVDKAIYVVGNGGGVWGKMGEKEGWIMQEGGALSGWAGEGEILVAGNSRFWGSVMLGAVKAAVESPEGEEVLGTMVRGNDDGEGAVGVVIKVLNSKSEIPNLTEMPETKKQEVMMPVKEKVEKLWRRMGSVYVVNGDKTKARKQTMYVGLGFLIILLVLAGGWQIRAKELARKTSEANQRLENATYKYQEAKALVELNPARSRELLGEVNEDMKRLSELRGAEKDPRFGEIKNGFGEVLGAATGVKKASMEEVLDLGLLREGMKGSSMEKNEDGLVVLDKEGQRLITVDPEKKKGEVVAGKDDLHGPKLMAAYPGKVTVVSEAGIVACNTDNWKCAVEVPPEDGEMVDMGMFGGNIYILALDGIYKHQGVENGYGAQQMWFSPGDDQLNAASSMAIDGSIWVMAGKKILKYTRGARESFEISGLDKELGSRTRLYTDEDTDKLYILDPENARVVVIKKTGEYDSQYVNEDFKEAVDVVVGNKIYVLVGSKIYESNK